MYKKVNELNIKPKNLNDLHAKIVSYASCGEYDQAAEYLQQSNLFNDKARLELATALAMYMPTQALELLGDINDQNAALYLSLLWKLQLREQAKQQATSLINQKIRYEMNDRYGQLNLILANVLANQASDKLLYLNQFLAHNQINPVKMINPDLPLNVHNISAETQVITQIQGLSPLVSIIVTAYNAVDTIEMNLKSLLKQSYQNIEIIIVDDSSTDKTVEKVRQFTREYSRIKLIQLKVNVGTYVAKTIGFQYASGEFITCHDSDDWAHPQRIETQLRPLIEHDHLVATTCNWVRVDEDGNFYARQIYPLNRLDPASPMFRKVLIEQEMGLWNLVRTGADSEFLARMKLVFGRKSVLAIKKPLVLGYHRANSLMTASDTGHHSDQVSPIRLEYWEAWNNWHIHAIKHAIPLKMPDIQAYESPFPVPKNIEVSIDTIYHAAQSPV
ncbi:MAG: glycosyltransferase family 2 protein [Acinetobacter sp.]